MAWAFPTLTTLNLEPYILTTRQGWSDQDGGLSYQFGWMKETIDRTSLTTDKLIIPGYNGSKATVIPAAQYYRSFAKSLACCLEGSSPDQQSAKSLTL